jgi:hypothetical protein
VFFGNKILVIFGGQKSGIIAVIENQKDEK